MISTLDRKGASGYDRARLVEADTTFVRELKVQWGADQRGTAHSRK